MYFVLIKLLFFFFFFFNDTATTEIYTTYDTLSLHDALPIFDPQDPNDRGEFPAPRPRALAAEPVTESPLAADRLAQGAAAGQAAAPCGSIRHQPCAGGLAALPLDARCAGALLHRRARRVRATRLSSARPATQRPLRHLPSRRHHDHRLRPFRDPTAARHLGPRRLSRRSRCVRAPSGLEQPAEDLLEPTQLLFLLRRWRPRRRRRVRRSEGRPARDRQVTGEVPRAHPHVVRRPRRQTA